MPEFDDPAYPELAEAPADDDLFLILRGPAAPTHPSETMRVKAQHVGGSASAIVGQSLVSGSLTVPGGTVSVGDASEGTPGVYFYTGDTHVGIETWTVDGTSGDITGMYLVGKDTNINSPGITISGATGIPGSLQAGDINIKAGDTITDVTPSENTLRAGQVLIDAGGAHDTDAGLNGDGASIHLTRATAAGTGVGGSIEIVAGIGTDTHGAVSILARQGFQVTTVDGTGIVVGRQSGVPTFAVLGASAVPQQAHQANPAASTAALAAWAAVINQQLQSFGFQSLV